MNATTTTTEAAARRWGRTKSKTMLLATAIEADQPAAAEHLRYLGRQLIATQHRVHHMRRARDELVTAVEQLMRHTSTQTIAAVAAALERAKTEH